VDLANVRDLLTSPIGLLRGEPWRVPGSDLFTRTSLSHRENEGVI
jgi:hypothetical protein